MFTHLFLMEQEQNWVENFVGAVFYCSPALGGCSYALHQWAGIGCTRGLAPYTWARHTGDWPAFALLSIDDELAPGTPFARFGDRLWTVAEADEFTRTIHGVDTARIDLFRSFRRVAKRIWRTQPFVRTHMLIVRGVPTAQIIDISPKRKGPRPKPGRGPIDIKSFVPTVLKEDDGDGVVPYRPLKALIAYWQMVLGPAAAPPTITWGGPPSIISEEPLTLARLVAVSRQTGESFGSDCVPVANE